MACDPLGVLVMADEPVLHIPDRRAVERDQERARGVAAFHHVADEAEFFLRLAPPFLHVRLAEPRAEQRVMFRLHGQKTDLIQINPH